jgi:hypothetical protein
MTSSDPAGVMSSIAIRRLSATSFKSNALPSMRRALAAGGAILRLRSETGSLEVIVEALDLQDLPALRLQADRGRMRLVIGDASQLEIFNPGECYANLLQVDVDLRLGQILCSTSLVGLPPVFLHESAGGSTLAAPLLPDRVHWHAPGGVDVQAAADVLRWGHPIDGRTLARNLRLAPVAARVLLAEDGLQITRLPAAQRNLTRASAANGDIMEQQIAAFVRAAKRLNLSKAFLSLSGGLDSRAVAVAMLATGRPIMCVTLARDHRSLDAQLAVAFCKAYGATHQTILTGAAFRYELAERVVRSAELTLGVSALSQSVDLYLYEQMGTNHRSRISGNLGNQVGRGGVESVTASEHPEEIFSPELQRALRERPVEPWYVERMRSRGFSQTLFTEEVNYWSIPNYVLGSAHALQLTPYADSRLIRLASELFATFEELTAPTAQSIRRRDLRHRLAGPPLAQSFQRSFLRRVDLSGKDVAINWGWLSRGGWSPRWLARALPTAASAGLSKLAPRLQRAWHALPPFGLVDWPTLLKEDLRDLTHDCLASEAVRSSGLFDNEKMARLLERHFRGIESNHGTVARALEIGLACMVLARRD